MGKLGYVEVKNEFYFRHFYSDVIKQHMKISKSANAEMILFSIYNYTHLNPMYQMLA